MKFEMNSEYSFGFIFSALKCHELLQLSHIFTCIRIPTKNIKK